MFGVSISDIRGQKAQCDICSKDFNLIVKEHQCKRCKRAVCYNCSHHKRPVYQLKKFTGKKHRCCIRCKLESDGIEQFCSDNKLVFGKDTISKIWLDSLQNKASYQQINNEYFEYLNDPKFEQKFNSGDEIDKGTYSLFKKAENSMAEIYAGLTEQFNYSLQDFFYQIISNTDTNTIVQQIKNIMKAFLSKNPRYGFSEELSLLIIFMLCFASEPIAFKLIDLAINRLIPKQLYPYNIKKNGFQNEKFISTILQLLQYAYKMNQNDLNLFNQYLNQDFTRLSCQMTINAMTFENTFQIFDRVIKDGNYTTYLKILSVICQQKAEDIKRYALDNNKMRDIILRNLDNEKMIQSFLALENLDEQTQALLNEQIKQQDQAAPTGLDDESLQNVILQSEQYKKLEQQLRENQQQLQQKQEENGKYIEQVKKVNQELDVLKKKHTFQLDLNKSLSLELLQNKMVVQQYEQNSSMGGGDSNMDSNSELIKSKFIQYESQLKELTQKLDLREQACISLTQDRQNIIDVMQKLQEEKRQSDQMVYDLAFQNSELEYKVDELSGRSLSMSRMSRRSELSQQDKKPTLEQLNDQLQKTKQKLEETNKNLDALIIEGSQNKMSLIRLQRLQLEFEYEKNTLQSTVNLLQEELKEEKDKRLSERKEANERLKAQYKKMFDQLQSVYEQNEKSHSENEQYLLQIDTLNAELRSLQRVKQLLEQDNQKLLSDNEELKRLTSAADKMETDVDAFAEFYYLENEGDEERKKTIKKLFARIKSAQQEIRFKNIDSLIKKEYVLQMKKQIKILNETINKKNMTIDDLVSQNDLLRLDQYNPEQSKSKQKKQSILQVQEEKVIQVEVQPQDKDKECIIF